MNEKELAEIKRRFNVDKSNIDRIRGCYINENKEIISEFNQSLALMTQEESEELLAILKKTLSGTLEKNLIGIEFTTQQVLESEEHKLLMAIRSSSLSDDEAVQAFYKRIINSVEMEGNYLILLASDKYDVPSYSKGGEKDDESSTVFSYFICCICPVKLSKAALSYYAKENRFRNITPDWLVSMPEFGFMFPSFDSRCANIYQTLYYYRNIAENHGEFTDAVFGKEAPMPAAEQKEVFQSILAETVAEDCSYEVVQSVNNQLCEMIEEHKANKDEDPLTISKATVKGVLKSCGVSDEYVTAFEEKYDSEFGSGTEISPKSIVNQKQIEVCTPDVSIRVSREHSDLVETRIIDGVKYVLIRADAGVEVNGVNIHIT